MRMNLFALPWIMAIFLFVGRQETRAVVTFGSGDSAHNTTAPVGALASSGWQFTSESDGTWSYPYVATLVSSNCVLASKQLAYGNGTRFVFNGVSCTATQVISYPDVSIDLQIFRVDTVFPSFARLYLESDELGKDFVMIGNGACRSDQIIVSVVKSSCYRTNMAMKILGLLYDTHGKKLRDSILAEFPDATFSGNTVGFTVCETVTNQVVRGWKLGSTDRKKRWGVNAFVRADGNTLAADFDCNGDPDEGYPSLGDFPGPVFAKNSNGKWCLAGIMSGIEGPYKTEQSRFPMAFYGAIFDKSGLYEGWNAELYWPLDGIPKPSRFYMIRISSLAPWIESVIAGGDGDSD